MFELREVGFTSSMQTRHAQIVEMSEYPNDKYLATDICWITDRNRKQNYTHKICQEVHFLVQTIWDWHFKYLAHGYSAATQVLHVQQNAQISPVDQYACVFRTPPMRIHHRSSYGWYFSLFRWVCFLLSKPSLPKMNETWWENMRVYVIGVGAS